MRDIGAFFYYVKNTSRRYQRENNNFDSFMNVVQTEKPLEGSVFIDILGKVFKLNIVKVNFTSGTIPALQGTRLSRFVFDSIFFNNDTYTMQLINQ